MSKSMSRNASSQNEAQPPAPQTLDVYGFVPAAVYRRKKAPPPPFSEDEILQWADAFHQKHGCWPIARSGPIPQAYGETWRKVDSALRRGGRGLLPGSSLALLLFRHRGRRHPLHLARFTEAQVLEWADAYFARHGTWPGGSSGVIPECPAVTWETVHQSLTENQTKDQNAAADTMPLGEIIFDLREARKRRTKSALSEAQILAWADEHFQRTGEWPRADGGRVEASPDETWSKVASALERGSRGLSGGSSLARLLEQERGRVNRKNQPPYTVPQILAWADAHHARTGKWPAAKSGTVAEYPSITWNAVHSALVTGCRGLPGGSSLPQLLQEHRGKRKMTDGSPLTEELVLEWADAHRVHTGQWPNAFSGVVEERPDSTWFSVNLALKDGRRGLPGGTTLALLLAEKRGKRQGVELAPVTEAQILAWADAFHAQHGQWPTQKSGPVAQMPDITWGILDKSLSEGRRSLPGGSSLPRLLAQSGRKSSYLERAPLSEEQILGWADAHFARTGTWPGKADGAIMETAHETWRGVQNALRKGERGLPGGSSLAGLLAQSGRRHSHLYLPDHTEGRILAWADAHMARTGQWPTQHSGSVPESPTDTWRAIDAALRNGGRGLPGGTTLPGLLERARGKRHVQHHPLTVDHILHWADAFYARTGRWPSRKSGPIPEQDGETWFGVGNALHKGLRGLPKISLACLLEQERGKAHPAHLSPLMEAQILEWADAHHARTGRWPTAKSGPIDGSGGGKGDGETWGRVENALLAGGRSLEKGSSLARLLAQHGRKANLCALPPYSEAEILEWADAFYARHGQWPVEDSGPIPESEGSTWIGVASALSKGSRGLPGGTTLARLLAEKRGKRHKMDVARLTEEQILIWADAHFARTGQWPSSGGGSVPEAPEENWRALENALGKGMRGLPGGSSLAKLLQAHRAKAVRAHYTPLTLEQVVRWVIAHRERTGHWPTPDTGAVLDAEGEDWSSISSALYGGSRGLQAGCSLRRLTDALDKQAQAGQPYDALTLAPDDLYREKSAPAPPLSEEQILQWADAYHARHGDWPLAKHSGSIPEAEGETWQKVNGALTSGTRGLPGGSSLAQLLMERRGRVNRKRQVPYTEEQILAWADAHYARTGQWPTQQSGTIADSPADNWGKVSAALSAGGRGLPGGTSLARLLEQKRGRRSHLSTTPLSVECVLAWADAHFARTGTWPGKKTGLLPEDPTTTWAAIDHALARGTRGLPGGSSLARLLAGERGRRNRMDLPPLSEGQILKWADAHHARTGKWPVTYSGPVAEQPDTTWTAVDSALHGGSRGLPGGSSLARLLAENGRKRNRLDLSPLCEEDILVWADAHKERTGQWPTTKSGRVPEREDTTWASISDALSRGARGLAGGSSLAYLLRGTRRVQNMSSLPPLSEDLILQWADDYHAREGRWPSGNSGPIGEGVDGTWGSVADALREGRHGLPGGSSLALLLQEQRGRRNINNLPEFTEAQILAWVDIYHARTGRWPKRDSGPIAEAAESEWKEDEWKHVNNALIMGLRGLPGGSSLSRLLADQRGVPHPADLAKFTEAQVLHWADAYHTRHGRWPNVRSGVVDEQPDVTWLYLHDLLYGGGRGLPGGSSLAQLLARERGMRHKLDLPPLTPEQVLTWADAFYSRTGEWPQNDSGPVAEAPGETWCSVSSSLQNGTRGLPKGLSLSRFLKQHRPRQSRLAKPPLSFPQIAEWAIAHRDQTGAWPNREAGNVAGELDLRWSGVDAALKGGTRGLPGGSSLRRFCAELENETGSENESHSARWQRAA